MTSETRTTIDAGDILAVETQCSACGARLSRTVKEYRGELFGCQNCGAQWSHLSEDFKRLGGFVGYLRWLTDRTQSADFPFKIRLEIAQPMPKDKP